MTRLFTGIIILVGLIIQSDTLFAQQDAMFSQYSFNTLALNPAYAGSRNVLAATAIYRNQWVGIPGAPKTGTLTVDAPFSRERIGGGIQFVSDKIGVTTTTGGVLDAAYRIPINEGTLAFGMQGSIIQYHAAFSSVVLDPAGPVPDGGFRADINRVLFNTGAGIYYNTERSYIGLSVQDLIPNKLGDTISTIAKQTAHAFLLGGHVFPLGTDFNLKSGFLVKGVRGAPVELDINAMMWVKNILAVGMGYRTQADISFIGQLRVTPQVHIGYSYDKSITALKEFNSGSHEFMIRYEFSFDRDKILSPRYF